MAAICNREHLVNFKIQQGFFAKWFNATKYSIPRFGMFLNNCLYVTANQCRTVTF